MGRSAGGDKMNKHFLVKNLAKTIEKHMPKVERLKKAMEAQGLSYEDILDSDSWQVVDTKVENRLQLWERMNMKTKERSICHLINEETRQVIINTLEYYGIPKSYDTAFFISNYARVCESMTDILESIQARRA
jgi:hypothetical protein